MNASRGVVLIGMVLVAVLAAGCASAPTRLQREYGRSYHMARISQTLHPSVETNLTPLAEFDGKAAKHLIDRYRATFEKPSPPPSFLISVGGFR